MRSLKYYFSICFTLLSLTIYADHYHFPSEFSVKQIKSLVTTFYLESKNTAFGKVIKDERPESTLFHFFDEKDQLLAIGKTNYSTNSSSVEVLDSNKQALGKIIQELHVLLPSKYKIYDKNNTLVAIGEMNWLGTRFSLVDPHNGFREYANFSRSYYDLFDSNWKVKMIDMRFIDPRFIIMIAAFQADNDTKNNEIEKRGS